MHTRQTTHPHAEATYHVTPNEDGTFSVEVRIPDSHPTKVGPFETAADADAWIAEQRARVEAQSAAGSGSAKIGAGVREGSEQPQRVLVGTPSPALTVDHNPAVSHVPGMTKTELVRRLAAANPHLLRSEAEAIVDTIFGEIAASLERGDRIELRGFGAFTVKRRDARVGRNPRTGDSVQVAEKHIPLFRAGKLLRDRLNPRR